MREKPAFAKHTETSRRKHSLPSQTTTLRLKPNATETTEAQSRSVTATIPLHRNDIVRTLTRSLGAARRSPFLHAGTAMTLRPPLSRAGPDEINGNTITARRKNPTGTERESRLREK